jgi:uncharacterized protein YbjT (DUF2867 family)
MKKILLTGATGNVGSQLVKNLEGKDLNLSVMVRNEELGKAKVFADSGINTVIGDFADKHSLQDALSGIDIAYLLVPGVQNMLDLARNFIEAAKSSGVKRIVKQSVLGANQGASVEVPRIHGVIDDELIDSGIEYTIIKPNSFMQNFIGSAESIKSQNAVYFNFGDGKFSAIDVRDIAACTAATIVEEEHANKIYELTGISAIGGIDFANALSNVLGRKINYVAVSDEDAKKTMLGFGMDEWLVDNLIGFGQIFANNWAGTVTSDVFNLTGKQPISIEQFVKDFADYFRD